MNLAISNVLTWKISKIPSLESKGAAQLAFASNKFYLKLDTYVDNQAQL